MPSEVVQKENEIPVEAKEIIEKSNTEINVKENNAQETENKILPVNNKTEESNEPDDLPESENKENEEPTVEDIESKKEQAEELLAEGKRHLLLRDFQAASDVLSEACSAFGSAFGEMAEECAEAYFKYGCALLELSKDQISPVGLEEKDDEEDVSVDQEDSLVETDKNNVTNNSENSEVIKSDNTEKIEVQLAEKEVKSLEDEKKSHEDEEKSPEDEEKSPEDETSADEEEKPEEDIGEDEVNDLQVAWEMLDLAKVIYKKMDTEESKLKLAEVLMKCGEVSIEDEKFETAIEDMTESLQIRRLLLPEDSRIIAETLFQLGIAQELGGSGEQAVELLTEAAAVLDQRIKNLESLTDNTDKANEEVADIKTIVPEIRERIIDIKERKKAAVSALLAAVGAANEATNNGTSSGAKQAASINHLVRKRPKQEESDETPNKIPKIEKSTDVKQ